MDNTVKVRDLIKKFVIPGGISAISGAATLVLFYICWCFITTGDMCIKWRDVTEAGSVMEVTVTGLFITGAISGFILGIVVILFGLNLHNRLWIATIVGMTSTFILAILFLCLVSASALDHGPVAPGG